MAVTANQLIKARDPGKLRSGPVDDSITLYEGTMCFWERTSGSSEGYLTSDDDSGANNFAGIVKEKKDNSGGSAGDLTAEFWTEGEFALPMVGASQSFAGDVAYASDNYVTDDDSTNKSKIGRYGDYIDSATMWVEILPSQE